MIRGLTPGALVRVFGVSAPAVFLCPAGEEGAWVALVHPGARNRLTGAPEVSALAWDDLAPYVPPVVLVCCHCGWRTDDDGGTLDIKGRPVPAMPDAEPGDYCPLCGSDEDWPGVLGPLG